MALVSGHQQGENSDKDANSSDEQRGKVPFVGLWPLLFLLRVCVIMQLIRLFLLRRLQFLLLGLRLAILMRWLAGSCWLLSDRCFCRRQCVRLGCLRSTYLGIRLRLWSFFRRVLFRLACLRFSGSLRRLWRHGMMKYSNFL